MDTKILSWIGVSQEIPSSSSSNRWIIVIYIFWIAGKLARKININLRGNFHSELCI